MIGDSCNGVWCSLFGSFSDDGIDCLSEVVDVVDVKASHGDTAILGLRGC